MTDSTTNSMTNSMTDKTKKLHLWPTAVGSAALATLALMGGHAAYGQAASGAPPSQIGKPSPYQGVSAPPSDDTITTDSDSPDDSAPATGDHSAAPHDSAALKSRPASNHSPIAGQEGARTAAAALKNPEDEGIVTYVPGPPNALPEGTAFSVSLQQTLSASETSPGTAFTAKLRQDLSRDGRVLVPFGSELRGKVAYTSYGHRIGGPAAIHLQAEEFVLPNGTRLPIHAEVIDTGASNTKAAGEGNIENNFPWKRTGIELGAGAGGGALIGAAFAGPPGAAVGSIVGTGLMGVHFLSEPQSVEVPEGTMVVFCLTDPLPVNSLTASAGQ